MAADGADFLHVDVMDGHFVPNITLGADFVRCMSAGGRLPQEAHLMVADPGRWVEPFARAGAAAASVHIEAEGFAPDVLDRIAEAGMRPGVAVKPKTPLEYLEELLDGIDQVLVMCVEPGFAGQEFLPGSVDRVARLAEMILSSSRPIEIKVDGGITPGIACELARAGAGAIVAGSSSIFRDDAYVPGGILDLRKAIGL